jgi:type IV secretion system protein VirB10
MKDYNNQYPDKEQKVEVESKLSAVASNPKKSMILLVFIIIAIGYIIYSFFWSGIRGTPKVKPEVSKNIVTEETPKIDSNININSAPVLPDPPEITAPEAPPAPAVVPVKEEVSAAPPPPSIELTPISPSLTIPTIVPTKSISKSDLEERRRSPIMKMGGGGTGASTDGKATSSPNAASGFVAPVSNNFVPSKTTFNQQSITQIGNMKYIVAQGKLIDAILESSISTEFPGPVRAIVSRDVYSESDKSVLIPKGSRLIGEFASEAANGQVRVAIAWKRVIRPDGIDINVDSPAVDSLGKVGIKAEVDAKVADLLANVLVSTIVQIGANKAAQKILNPSKQQVSQSVTTNTDGSSTLSNIAPPDALAAQAVQDNVASTLKSASAQYTDNKPTLYVHQGTKIKVFVNRDLIFAKNYMYSNPGM